MSLNALRSPVDVGSVRTTPSRSRSLPAVALVVLALGLSTLLSGCGAGEAAAHAATSQVGKPYVYGAESPKVGFDCSGLTMWAWAQAGKRIPRTAAAQYAASYPVERKKLRLGDLAFYQVGGRISHVAMYIGRQRLVQARNPRYPIGIVALGWWGDHLAGYRRLR